VKSAAYVYTLSKNIKSAVDTDRLKADDLYEKYKIDKVEYRMSVKAVDNNDCKS